MSSYYLLGYYSTGKLDGKFHAISVRIKRPGVQVRCRYRCRSAAAGVDDEALHAIIGSGLLWSLAFGVFTVSYWPILSRPRLDGKPG